LSKEDKSNRFWAPAVHLRSTEGTAQAASGTRCISVPVSLVNYHSHQNVLPTFVSSDLHYITSSTCQPLIDFLTCRMGAIPVHYWYGGGDNWNTLLITPHI